MSETILQEAERLINGDRQDTYGPPSDSFREIADLWATYLDTEVTAHDVANLMILMKVSRSKRGFHRDSYVDIGGYAGLTEKLTGELPESVVPETQQWQSFLDIPEGVDVKDCDGDFWAASDVAWEKDDPDRLDPQRYAPYTEVL
ncbi:DUF6378 domain-containing protein [Mycobacteroides salmoniphilum]|uniref:DUF6378 domain-containing protein n=1 Tax=Mycobacteroides salmoniphilum TaxID=404941 RepID=UPI0009923261|nr:DUF6378 domain-containing protein [Mycobacteroides salmoniphilum]